MLLSEHGVAEGIWKARGGFFPLGDGPILPQVLEQCFQARGSSRYFHTAVAGKIPKVYLKLSGCCRCPPCTAADKGAEEGPGFKLQGGCEVLPGHWTTCLSFWFCSIVSRKTVQGSL